MKEILKNKLMVGFVLFMVMVSYINSIQMGTVMKNENKSPNEIVMNQN